MGRSEKSRTISETEASLRASEAGWGVTVRFALITLLRNKWVTISGAGTLTLLSAAQALLP